MATTNYSIQAAGARSLGRVVVTGIVAGMMMGVVEMIISAAGGQGFWAPLRYIAAVFTRGADTASGFSLGPVVVGLMGHMMNAVILTAIFALLAWRFGRNPIALAAAGMMWGALVFAVMWWAVVPTIDPAMGLLNGAGFFATHLIFGMVAGLGVAWARRAPAPASVS